MTSSDSGAAFQPQSHWKRSPVVNVQSNGIFHPIPGKVGYTLKLENAMQELNIEEIEIVSGGPQEGNIPKPQGIGPQ